MKLKINKRRKATVISPLNSQRDYVNTASSNQAISKIILALRALCHSMET